MSKKYTNPNKPQRKTIEELLKLLPSAHHVDVVVRIDGQDKYFEADWLYAYLREVEERKAALTNLREGGGDDGN